MLFDIGISTIQRIEKNRTSGKDALKRLEIYLYFPEIALYEIKKNGNKINAVKKERIEKLLQSELKKQK